MTEDFWNVQYIRTIKQTSRDLSEQSKKKTWLHNNENNKQTKSHRLPKVHTS